jgi:hypothetical protein
MICHELTESFVLTKEVNVTAVRCGLSVSCCMLLRLHALDIVFCLLTVRKVNGVERYMAVII